MSQIKPYVGHVAILLATIIWGTNAPIAKGVLEGGAVSAFALTTFRMFGAALLFWIASLFTKSEKVSSHDMLQLFFAALFGVVLNQGTFIFGLSLTSPINASIICSTPPIITMIVAAIYLKEPITSKKAGGIFLGASGALLLILGSQAVVSEKASNMWGDILCLCSQFCYAIYLTVFQPLVKRYSTITVLKWMFLYASICFIPVSYNDLSQIDLMQIDLMTYAKVGFVVVFATFLAYIAIPVAQKSLRPTVISMYNYLQPIVATSVAVFLGMDRFGLLKGIAIGLVFLGVYVVTTSKSKAQLDAERAAKKKQSPSAEA